MDESKLRTIEQIERFLAGNSEVEFSGYENDLQRYAHLSRVLRRLDYPGRNKRERGVLLRYLRRTSGYSRAQLTRLVARWHANRRAAMPLLKRYSAPVAPFERKYLAADIALLVEMDKANDNVCGPATVHLFKRAYQTYGDERYQRLASLSVSHLYNLRKSAGYQTQRTHFTKTHPVCNPIGVRKAPRPDGKAGFIRVDSVHQGDLDGIKGVYHITCVDQVSQWQVESCVQGISEAFLLPVLALVMAQFPFAIAGFHSDNGSEYINAKVAKLLSKLHIEQTKSRARHSNDNALAESKNASVVRKHMGYSHIPQKYAEPINHFYQQCFNPWLNLHRPSMFATEIVSPKGKIVKRYNNKDVKTPLECLVLLDKQGLVSFKTSATLTALLIQSSQMTDLMAAQQMQHAKSVLFKSFANPQNGGRKNEQRYPASISPRTAAGRLESAFNTRSI